MNALIDAALHHSRTVLSSLVLLLLCGVYGYVTIAKESAPDINIPILYVSMTLDGISPEDAERLLLRPMETELKTVEGIEEMRSTAYQGGANIVLEFDAGFDVDAAMDDVREKVDRAKPELPESADEPTVNEINFSLFPVVVVSLSGDVPERTLLRLARDLKDEIEALPPVLEANISGDRDEVVEVVIDPLMIESYGLETSEVVGLISRSNRLIAAGNLDTGDGRFGIKVPGLFESVEDILNMPIKTDGEAVVRFRDVAQVKRTFKDAEGYARLNGAKTIALEVKKRTGQNIIETIEMVQALVKEEQTFWPSTVKVDFTQDQSRGIRIMLSDLENNTIAAILLVMIVVVAALGLSSAGLVGLAVPGAFLTGILVLYVGGLTVNMVVLFSLILAVGMLVDGAIVVVEYADRKMREGSSPRAAFGRATKRMAWPITASTATTLAAFLPLLFWPGVVGEFMKFLPITLIATLTASLMMALIFVPTLGAVLRGGGKRRKPIGPSPASQGGNADLDHMTGIGAIYIATLRWALHAPVLVILLALGGLIGAYTAYGLLGKGVEFFPEVEPDFAALQIHARGNMSIEERDQLVREVEAEVLAMQAERREFRAIYAVSQASSIGNQDQAEDVIGTVQLEFTDWDRRRKAEAIFKEIRARTSKFAGIYVEPRKQEEGPPTGKPVQVELSSRWPDTLPGAATKVRAYLDAEVEGLRDIEDSRSLPGIEWELAVDRSQAARFGADVTLVGNMIKMVTNGIVVGDYTPDDSDEEVDIITRFPERYRTLDQLDQVRVRTNSGLVPISNFVTRQPVPKVGQINRVDGLRVITLKADIEEGVLADDKVKEISTALPGLGLDKRVKWRFKGEDKEQKETADFLSKAFLVALFIMAVILVTQFNSFYSALLILSAVVMSTVGVLLGLLITGQPFGMVMSGIGVIALAGIVVNNNIVLIDTFDYLRKAESDPMMAILRTGAQRLRPVLLTTATTILGLMPMVLSMNIDFISREVKIGAPSTQWWTQLSTAIAFGLAFATVLTLIVTPCLLMLRERVKSWRRRVFHRKHARQIRAQRQEEQDNDDASTPAEDPTEPPHPGPGRLRILARKAD